MHTQKKILVLVLLLFAANSFFSTRISPDKKIHNTFIFSADTDLFTKLDLSTKGLKKEVFEKALSGWKRLNEYQQLEKPGLLTIADLSQSSNSKRLYVIDLENEALQFQTYVAHGRNSGEEFAEKFGNEPQSFRSSLGFYLTGGLYKGAHGLSMKLEGLEKGINHHALERGIVVHGASYVSEKFIRHNGRLGRSQGCPALPEKENKRIISQINGGSCFFVFYPDSDYLRASDYLK